MIESLTRGEHLFILAVIVFALSFPVLDIVFRPLKRFYDRNKGL
jgi:hypothetical protein